MTLGQKYRVPPKKNIFLVSFGNHEDPPYLQFFQGVFFFTQLRSAPEVLLRWALDQGVAVIPGSNSDAWGGVGWLVGLGGLGVTSLWSF